jgi:hypothetical protein
MGNAPLRNNFCRSKLTQNRFEARVKPHRNDLNRLCAFAGDYLPLFKLKSKTFPQRRKARKVLLSIFDIRANFFAIIRLLQNF